LACSEVEPLIAFVVDSPALEAGDKGEGGVSRNGINNDGEIWGGRIDDELDPPEKSERRSGGASRFVLAIYDGARAV
jgi:hypothetical protein